MRRWFLAALAALCLTSAARAGYPADYAAPTKPAAAPTRDVLTPASGERLYSPDAVARLAAQYLGTIPDHKAKYARFLSLHAVPRAARAQKKKLLDLVLNCLSGQNPDLPLSVTVPYCDDVVVYVDLEVYGIPLAVFEKLGLEGSGSAPFPDPYFHHTEDSLAYAKVVEETELGYWLDGYGRQVTKGTPGARWQYTRTEKRWVQSKQPTLQRRVLQAPWISKDALAALTTLTHAEVPLLEANWFVVHATIEPRYHELLGLDDTLESALKLAAVDEILSDKLGSILRGVALFSEVASRNRALERAPTGRRYGRGSFHQSLDFKTSIRNQDALGDLLLAQPDARELIFSLANGLHGYFVVDGKGKRLNFADPEIAQDDRTRLKDHLVWTGRNCMGCHWPASGIIPVEEEVREFSRKQATLAVERAHDKDRTRAERIKTRYLDVDFNELAAADQVHFAVAVKAVTGGWSTQTAATELQETIRLYTDAPVTVAQLARECGVEADVLAVALTGGGFVKDHALVGLGTGRKQRRDQIEASIGQVLFQLYALRKGS